MDVQNLRDMSDEELLAQLDGLAESIFRLRFKVSLGEMGALSNYRQARKSLARIKTILRQRELSRSEVDSR